MAEFTKRELITVMCMQGLLANPTGQDSVPADNLPRIVAMAAVEFADALMVELKNVKGGTN